MGWCSALPGALIPSRPESEACLDGHGKNKLSDGSPGRSYPAGHVEQAVLDRPVRAITRQKRSDKSTGVRRTGRRPGRLDLTKQHNCETGEGFHRAAGGADGKDSHPALMSGGLPGRLAGKLFERYPIRGRWFKQAEYGALRNAAWMVRNSRVGQGNNPLALRVVVVEVAKLVDAGEALPDVVEALCELLVHP
jgi:hypothetical protein